MGELATSMGHDSMETTFKHYAQFSPDYLAKVANAISRAG